MAGNSLHTGEFPCSVRYGRSVSPAHRTPAQQPTVGRIPIRLLSPRQPDDRRPAKAWVGEVVPFRATVFKDGHDRLGVELLLTAPSGAQTAHRMRLAGEGTDLWEVMVQLDETGDWDFAVRAWTDDWATWLQAAEVKVPAGIDAQLVLATGAVLLHRAANERPSSTVVATAFQALADTAADPATRLAAALDA